MARDENTDDVPWGDADWQPTAPATRPESSRNKLFAAAVTALVLAACGAVLFNWQRAAVQRAEEARAMAEAARVQAETIEARLAAERAAAAALQDPVEVMRMMAADAKALAALGRHRLEMNEIDQAVDAFKEAALLDPQYADELLAAQKRQDAQDRIAPPPRPIERPE